MTYRTRQMRASLAWELLAARSWEVRDLRRDSVIATLADESSIALRDTCAVLELLELLCALAWLGQPRPGDDGAAELRRLECREWTSLFEHVEPRVTRNAVDTWALLVERFPESIESVIPDLKRELAELRAALPG